MVFKKTLHPCALYESSLSIRKVKKAVVILGEGTGFERSDVFFLQVDFLSLQICSTQIATT